MVLISQSGETADTLEALRRPGTGRYTLAVVNRGGSSIAQAADSVLYTRAGPVIAVATTKAYSTQLAVMGMMAVYLADIRGTVDESEYERDRPPLSWRCRRKCAPCSHRPEQVQERPTAISTARICFSSAET